MSATKTLWWDNQCGWMCLGTRGECSAGFWTLDYEEMNEHWRSGFHRPPAPPDPLEGLSDELESQLADAIARNRREACRDTGWAIATQLRARATEAHETGAVKAAVAFDEAARLATLIAEEPR